MWVSAAHIPGTQNTEADSFSRNVNETIAWKLSTHLFQKISSMFGNPTLDLFASRINYQIDRYISWKLDPKALTIDAFSIKWNTDLYYIFPPFTSLGKVTAKIYRDKTKESSCSSPQMAHTVLAPQPLEKSEEKHGCQTISKNLLQPQNPQEQYSLTKEYLTVF